MRARGTDRDRPGTQAPPGGRARRRRPPGSRTVRRATALACVALLALGGGACTGSEDGDDGATTAPDPTSQPSTSAPRVSPFTGREGPQHAVLAVKFGNTRAARPHTGLQAADLVYVEKVEGGLSRLMGVYASRSPESVGPVRSARESDLELLRQFGHPAFAYSGVRTALRDDMRESAVRTVPRKEAPEAFYRSTERPVPNNLFLRPAEALRAAPEASMPRDIGFRFGPAPDGGEKDGHHTVRYPAARFAFDWSAEQERWLISMDGEPARATDGERLGAPTVVLQRVTMRPSRFRDVAGAVTPYIETVGSGRATVLRDGRAYDVRWERPSATDGTAFTRPGGDRMPFDRGQVWIVYAEG